MKCLVFAVLATVSTIAPVWAEPVEQPELLTAPTGWLLPGGVLYGKASVDHAGGVGSQVRIGLGGVAELGLASTELFGGGDRGAERGRIERVIEEESRELPFATAIFRMGLVENRLFHGQPGVVLGFRKSFAHDHDGVRTRFAELHLVASKHVGARIALHVGGSLWDASIEQDGAAPFVLHDQGLARQVRVFGGIETRPREDTAILVDLSWMLDDRLALRPVLAWGVRYQAADWIQLQSGVRVTDIGNATSRDARIFGQVTLVTRALRRKLMSMR